MQFYTPDSTTSNHLAGCHVDAAAKSPRICGLKAQIDGATVMYVVLQKSTSPVDLNLIERY